MGVGNVRNKPCHCGSGRKLKKCCVFTLEDLHEDALAEDRQREFRKSRKKSGKSSALLGSMLAMASCNIEYKRGWY